jgi:hypothetical protein
MTQSNKDQDIIWSILHPEFSNMNHEWSVVSNIVNICGLKWDNWNNADESISFEEFLTREILESHYDKILEKLPSDNEYHDHLNHMVLGALIVREKAKMPKELKERILHHINWDAELKWRWKTIDKEKQKDFLEERKKLIDSFRHLILNYQS